MVDDQFDVLAVVLNLVLAQVNDRECCRILQVLRFDQGEELDPVTMLQRVLVQLLGEVNDDRRLLD